MNKIYKLIIPLIPIIFLVIETCTYLKDSILEYLFFCLISNLYFFMGFRKKSMFYETFLATFLWLGFWLKISLRVSFNNSMFYSPIGNFNFSYEQWSGVFITVSIAILTLIIFSLIREKFFYYDKTNHSHNHISHFQFFYKKNRKIILCSFILFVILVTTLNAQWGIYQRGEITKTFLPYGLNNFFKLLLLYGFTSISTLFISYEIKLRNKVSILLYSIFNLETFFSSVSMLSRAMILNTSAVAWGILRSFNIRREKIGYKSLLIFSFITFLLFSSSIIAVSQLRKKMFIDSKATNALNTINISQTANHTLDLILGRWVGAESMFAVQGYKNRGFGLLYEALNEEYSQNKMSFFDKNFIKSPYINTDFEKHHFVTLPGFIAFLAYTDSLVFIFLSCLVLSLICFSLEFLSFKVSNKNIIFCSLIGYFLSFRLTHFGYVPNRSYLFLTALLLIILFPKIFNWIIKLRNFFVYIFKVRSFN